MEIKLALEGFGATTQTEALSAWLREARIRGVETMAQERQPPKPGEQGPTLLAIIGVVLAGPAVVELVRSIHRWIEAVRPTITITVTAANGRTVTIDARNPKSITELTAEANKLAGP